MKTIVAICGKSASGKDTLLNKMRESHSDYNFIVKDTSRPPRQGEVHGVDYNFVDFEDIVTNSRLYLCRSIYRGWAYGTRLSQLKDGVNVGIFSPNDLLQIKDFLETENIKDVTVVPVYLDIDNVTRKERSIQRDGRFNLERIRRSFTDKKDFQNIDHIIRSFPGYLKWYGNGAAVYKVSSLDTKYRYNTCIVYEIEDILSKMGINSGTE